MEGDDAWSSDVQLDRDLGDRVCAVVARLIRSWRLWLVFAYIGMVGTQVGLYDVNRRSVSRAHESIASVSSLAHQDCLASNQNRAVIRRILADSDKISLRLHNPEAQERVRLHAQYARTLLKARFCP